MEIKEENNQKIEDFIKDGYNFPKMSCSQIKYKMREIKSFDERQSFVRKYLWSIPCKEAIDAIKKHSLDNKITDIMAGSGWWAKNLADSGMEISAIDNRIGKNNQFGHQINHFRIKEQDCTTWAKENTKNPVTILISWPPYEENDAFKCVKMLAAGSIICYIGEGIGGCCGSNNLFNFFENECEKIEEIEIPQFCGMNDYLIIYKKRNKKWKIKTEKIIFLFICFLYLFL